MKLALAILTLISSTTFARTVTVCRDACSQQILDQTNKEDWGDKGLCKQQGLDFGACSQMENKKIEAQIAAKCAVTGYASIELTPEYNSGDFSAMARIPNQAKADVDSHFSRETNELDRFTFDGNKLQLNDDNTGLASLARTGADHAVTAEGKQHVGFDAKLSMRASHARSAAVIPNVPVQCVVFDGE